MTSTAITIVQYVLVRADLMRSLNWPLGAVIAQACHASVAATQIFSADQYTQLYLQDLDNMHKVILEIPDKEELLKVHELLDENKIDHKIWIEHPENIPTCIALKPYPKTDVQKYFRKYKLLKYSRVIRFNFAPLFISSSPTYFYNKQL